MAHQSDSLNARDVCASCGDLLVGAGSARVCVNVCVVGCACGVLGIMQMATKSKYKKNLL